jgi:protein involved in polysaccharide export with SLBB domain
MGMDLSIADAYFDRLDGSAVGPLDQSADFLQALAVLGAFNDPSGLLPSDTMSAQRDSLARTLGAIPDSVLTVFGRSIFGGVTTEFQPEVTGPVDPDYQLGPGDQLQLILTGDVELALPLDVTREGFIVIPDVGQIFVNGLTLGNLTDALYARLGAVYSGVRQGGDATTTFHVALGRLRSNQVFLMGDVSLPGAYQVSSVATVFNALYNAGGPGEQGSMRSIEVRRGRRLAGEVDLYDYLIEGDASEDIRLEQGDRLFVPIVGSQISIDGFVRRPAIYELKPGEQLRDLIRFAGGPQPAAYLRRIQIDRILPPAERTPGRERMLLDVDLETMPSDEDFALIDGDRVTILGIGDRRDNQVVVEGHVEKPGLYELAPNMTLGDVITRAGGLLPDAFDVVAHLIRLEEADSTYVLERVSLEAGGQPEPDVVLREMDRVVIYGRSELRTAALVSIGGEVKDPGVFPLNVGMTAEDLLLAAGGFTERADPLTAELVRRLQGLRDEGDVVLSGEVLYPGPYALEYRGETVSSLLQRSGGLTPDAYRAGGRLVRSGLPLGLDLEDALASPGSAADLLLLPGDSLEVPQFDGTVQILGAVEFQSRTRWQEGMSLGDYLDQAGGVVENGDRNRAVVTYANQERQRSRKFLIFRSDPRVEPGSTISVPFKEPREGSGFNADQLLARITGFVTLVVLFDQLKTR